jgi:hypothetical protein
MAETGTGLFRRRGKCAGNPRRISCIRPELVFRGAQEKSAENANEISALRSELVFRQIPGELVQRHRHSQRFGGRIFRDRALLDSVCGCVLRIPLAPVRLCLPAPGCLTLRLAAGALSRSDSRVRPKPLPTYPARSLPGLWHGELSSSPHQTWLSYEFRSEGRVSFGKQSRVNSRARRSTGLPHAQYSEASSTLL